MNKTEFVCRFGRKKWDNFALVGWKILEGNYKRDTRAARDRDNHCNHAKRLHVGIHTSASFSHFEHHIMTQLYEQQIFSQRQIVHFSC